MENNHNHQHNHDHGHEHHHHDYPYDLYCERGHDLIFWAEPINFITNLAFIIAGILIIKKLVKNSQFSLKKLDIIFLSIVLILIGVGSAAYHSIPNKITLLMDVIPIAIFIHFYIPVFYTRTIGLKVWLSILILFIFIGFSYLVGTSFPADTLNGSIGYIPAYFMLILMSIILFIKKNIRAKYLTITVIIWTLSIASRTLDVALCNSTFNVGTHYIWHLLNAVVLYRCLNMFMLENADAK